MSAEYKENVSLKDRQEDVKKALIKKPDYIPVFIEKSTTSNMPHLRSKTNDKIKSRYLLNGNLTIREFIECLHHNKTDEHDINDPIYLFHNNVLLSRSIAKTSQLDHSMLVISPDTLFHATGH